MIAKISLLVLLLFSCALSQDLFYYTCAYDLDSFRPNAVRVTKVNLDEKKIISENSIPIAGTITLTKPIEIKAIDRENLIVFANNGILDKNSESLNSPELNYAVLDSGLNILKTASIQKMDVSSVVHGANDSLQIKYHAGSFENNVDCSAQLALNADLSIKLLSVTPAPYRDEEYPTIANFKYFVPIKYGNREFYWNVNVNGLYILKLDIDREALLDSLRIATSIDWGYLFGSAGDSLIYIFTLNYNSINTKSGIQKISIDPSYLIRFKVKDFSKIDSIPIPYPSIDFGYVQPELASCDHIGPYLVYYFFMGENGDHLSPAMLFIFDTRTNETTWLRVGWR